ncbi:3-deoxy-D-manno-octulosonic acid transferase [Paracoccus yeei]|uniref:3-deoxy-D-manno-octulosonic acid transferase n=1 Tax=Paracoccus yeei TaxID=147645 RepID=UPI0020C39B15|nr:glycosyltransferase N-terminal domain-containing protein [Paracoccus yeei]
MIWHATTALAGTALRLAAPFSGADWRERLALTGPDVVPGGIWLHAASVGELNSARVLAEALGAELPLTVTTNSLTGRALARKLGHVAVLAPLDVPQAVERFLARIEPSVLVTVENELWPNRSAMARDLGVAQVVVGARISERSAQRWARLPQLIGPMLRRIDLLSAQDEGSEARLLRLGLPALSLGTRLNLKLLGPAQVRPPEDGPGRARVVLAASTHEGEDEIVLDAYAQARRAVPDLRLILAPRHPRRGDAVAALIAARGLDFARRSQGGGWMRRCCWPTAWARWRTGIGRRGSASPAARWSITAAIRRGNPPPGAAPSCTAPMSRTTPATMPTWRPPGGRWP